MEDIERQYTKLPVIIVTAHDGYREDHRLSQANGYVVKSFELGELKQNIAHVLNRKTASEPMKAGESWHRISKFSSTEALEMCA
jgi:DNA-binding response OmpR family regulator